MNNLCLVALVLVGVACYVEGLSPPVIHPAQACKPGQKVSWVATNGKILQGHVSGGRGSVGQCKALCEKETKFVCRGFNYQRRKKNCYFLKTNRATPGAKLVNRRRHTHYDLRCTGKPILPGRPRPPVAVLPPQVKPPRPPVAVLPPQVKPPRPPVAVLPPQVKPPGPPGALKPGCPPTHCPMDCAREYYTINGCKKCRCKPGGKPFHGKPFPKPKCPLRGCKRLCPTGYEIDANGCVNTCKCKKPKCSPIRCRMACHNGFERDAHGCEICKCKLCHKRGTKYTGRKNKTISGKTCQRWVSLKPHWHVQKKRLSKKDLHTNFCRNPDNDAIGPWCYTTDPKVRYEACFTLC